MANIENDLIDNMFAAIITGDNSSKISTSKAPLLDTKSPTGEDEITDQNTKAVVDTVKDVQIIPGQKAAK
jgi:hypothetical protein